MAEVLQAVLKITLVLFLLGNLAGVGLELALRDAMGALRDVRFLVLTVVWGFVLCPAFAYLLTRIIPLERPYAVGLLLLGMAPCAPFLPIVVKKARGDLRYIAIMMLLTAVGTVGFMPLAVPVMIKGMTANTWAIAKPLLLFVLAPLIVGLAIRQWAEPLASRMYPMVKKTTDSATAVMLVTMLLIYGKGFLNLVGTYALATQVLFFSTMGLGAYWLGFGLKREERIVLSIGICTRNIGAAFAPLLTMEVDPRATVMVAVAVPITVLLSLVLARWFAGRGALGAVTADLTVQKSSVASGRTNNRP